MNKNEQPEVTHELSPLDDGACVFVNLTPNHHENKIIINGVDITAMTTEVRIDMEAGDTAPFVWVKLVSQNIVANLQGAAVDTTVGLSADDDLLELAQNLRTGQ